MGSLLAPSRAVKKPKTRAEMIASGMRNILGVVPQGKPSPAPPTPEKGVAPKMKHSKTTYRLPKIKGGSTLG